jgi:osmotically-inducible protein OsmY
MIRVSPSTIDQATAWRVRDTMARHPLLGGSIAEIHIHACREVVTLEGWVLDEGLHQLASRTAMRAAGSRPVAVRLRIRRNSQGSDSQVGDLQISDSQGRANYKLHS